MAVSNQALTPPAAPALGTFSFSTRLSSRGAFFVSAAFVVALLVLSQLPLLDGRGAVRASIVGAALVLHYLHGSQLEELAGPTVLHQLGEAW